LQGSSGSVVRFAQHALNQFRRAGFTTQAILTEDGIFGSATRTAVLRFQNDMRARYKDGVIDAESWSLIGMQINRLEAANRLNKGSFSEWYDNARTRIRPHRLSDGSTSWIAKRSWVNNGPSTIWELYAITFKGQYNFRGVTVVPWVGGDAQTMMVRSVHVTNASTQMNLTNYNSDWGDLTYMSHRPRDGQRLHIPFTPKSGNTIIVGVGQDRSSGYGTSRMFGIRDITAHARVTTDQTTPGTTKVTYQQAPITFTVTGDVNFQSLDDRVIQLKAPSFPQYHSVSNIKFNNITTNNPEVTAIINEGGRATFRSSLVISVTGTDVTRGSAFPDFNYVSMDENGRLNTSREAGWISRADGIRVLCDTQRNPVGFPEMPTGIGPNESQRHYVNLSLSSAGTHSDVQMGFYDFKEKKFIVSAEGKPEMSYLEYMRRGPHNVYVAVISHHELLSEGMIPVDDDAPMLPYRWAMPVYGVCTRAGSKITLDSLPDRLGPNDMWPIAVREGSFIRSSKLRSKAQGPLTGYLANYQNREVEAFYGLPEADLGGYSTIYGPPNGDVVDEEPVILDDDVIQVRQAPILMVQKPTLYPNPADPRRPVLRFYKRETRNSPWVLQPFHKIRDFNARTGELFLVDRLNSNDAGLLRVDYTTTRRSYYFKKHDDMFLNLNTYSGHARDLLGEAIYVYIVPHYVKFNGEVIPESVQERTLRVALSPDVFNPLRSEYDPLAVQLGVVYLSTALDVNRMAILDTRRRGGGLRDSANAAEIKRLVNEAWTYWDVHHATGASYQKGGFVVVRLPEELKEQFSEREITEVIEKNITGGVGFKIETLQGQDWS